MCECEFFRVAAQQRGNRETSLRTTGWLRDCQQMLIEVRGLAVLHLNGPFLITGARSPFDLITLLAMQLRRILVFLVIIQLTRLLVRFLSL